ncbi:unnamed protein product [Prorocentrum cordatum]|uniref:Uncharacterized protein n=1 Tax=Prorocentrum cordatum TaxID=2364126 RepID=A0ABN9SM65_9DINO|nr:unnamed protein product [Polarella glacialis]
MGNPKPGTAAHSKKKAPPTMPANARRRRPPPPRRWSSLTRGVRHVRAACQEELKETQKQLKEERRARGRAEKERDDAKRRLCSFQTWWSVFLKLCLQDCAGGREGAGRQGRRRPQELPKTWATEVKHWSESGVRHLRWLRWCTENGDEVGVDAHATVERWIQTLEEGVEEHVARKMDSVSIFADLLGGGPRKHPAAAKAAPKRRAKRSAKSRPAQAGVKERPVMKRPARSRPPAARTRKAILQVDESFLSKGKLSKLAKNARGKQELSENFKELSPPAGVAIVSDKWRGTIAAVKQYRNDAGLTERTLPHEVVNHSAGEITNERGFTTNHVELQWSLAKRWIRKRHGGTLPKKADRKKWSRLLAEHRFRTHIKASGQKVNFAALAATFQAWSTIGGLPVARLEIGTTADAATRSKRGRPFARSKGIDCDAVEGLPGVSGDVHEQPVTPRLQSAKGCAVSSELQGRTEAPGSGAGAKELCTPGGPVSAAAGEKEKPSLALAGTPLPARAKLAHWAGSEHERGATVRPGTDDRSLGLDELPRSERRPIDASRRWELFDGLRAHEVEDFEGERFSVILFSASSHASAKERLARAVALLPKPRGYKRPSAADGPRLAKRPRARSSAGVAPAPSAAPTGSPGLAAAGAKQAGAKKYRIVDFPHLGLKLTIQRVYTSKALMAKCRGDRAKLAALRIKLKDPSVFQLVED